MRDPSNRGESALVHSFPCFSDHLLDLGNGGALPDVVGGAQAQAFLLSTASIIARMCPSSSASNSFSLASLMIGSFNYFT